MLRGLGAFAAVNDFAGSRQVGHLFEGKGIAQNVLSEVFEGIVVVPLDAVASVDAEAAMAPLAHLVRSLDGEFTLLSEELEHAGS